MRSRAVRRDLACWLSTALGPPPSRIFSSSLRTWATRSASARMLDSKRRELGSTLVGSTLLMERAEENRRMKQQLSQITEKMESYGEEVEKWIAKDDATVDGLKQVVESVKRKMEE